MPDGDDWYILAIVVAWVALVVFLYLVLGGVL